MKLTALKCPSCGGPIELDEKDENIGYCQYCHTKYFLESEQPKVYIEYNQEQKRPSGIGRADAGKGKVLLAAAGGMIGVAALLLVFFSGSMEKMGKQPSVDPPVNPPVGVPAEAARDAGKETGAETSGEAARHTEAFESLVKAAFSGSYTSVTAEELGRLRFLSVKKGAEGWLISFRLEESGRSEGTAGLADSPADSAASMGDMQTIVSQEPLTAGDIAVFGKLSHLEVGDLELESGSLSGLSDLKAVTCDYIQPEELHQALGERAEKLEELNASHLKSIDGLSDFPGLKVLKLEDCRDITDLSVLAQLQSLTDLELNGMDEVADFSVLNVMKNLKRLWIDAENLRDIGFISHMPELTSLGITDSHVLLLDPLEGKESLRELKLEGNGEVRDYGPVGSLTGLETLVLDKYTSQADPDLTALTGLKKGEFHGMMGIRFLESLTGLKELKLQGCNVDRPSAIASLAGLEKLTYRKVWGELSDLSFLAGCGELRYLDMNHTDFYSDLSEAFNVPTLETLILDGSSFELRLDRLRDNPSLKALSLNGVSLYKDVKMSSDGMITSIDYDSLFLDDYTTFLAHYPSLEYLSLRSNQLTNIQFAADLKNLRELDIEDNYVTDTHVLDQLEYLGKKGTIRRPAADLDWADTVQGAK